MNHTYLYIGAGALGAAGLGALPWLGVFKKVQVTKSAFEGAVYVYKDI